MYVYIRWIGPAGAAAEGREAGPGRGGRRAARVVARAAGVAGPAAAVAGGDDRQDVGLLPGEPVPAAATADGHAAASARAAEPRAAAHGEAGHPLAGRPDAREGARFIGIFRGP